MESQVKISAERSSAGEYGLLLISRYHDLSSALAKPLVVYFHRHDFSLTFPKSLSLVRDVEAAIGSNSDRCRKS